jgi:hypothetical protein
LDPDSDWAKPAAGAPPKKARRMDEVAEPGPTSTVHDLGPNRVRTLFAEYQREYGDMSAPDIEPIGEEIFAVHQLMASGAPPYIDFAIFGPHGQRTLRKLSHTALRYNPLDGSWKRKEQDGPASFEAWWKSWRAFKTTLLLLDAVLPERLDRYAGHIVDLTVTYGHQHWWLVYRADVRMRQSRMCRRHCLAPPVPHSAFATRPWDAIFLEAIAQRDCWDTEVCTPALLLTARQSHSGPAASTNANRSQRPPAPRKGLEATGRPRPLAPGTARNGTWAIASILAPQTVCTSAPSAAPTTTAASVATPPPRRPRAAARTPRVPAARARAPGSPALD